MAYTQEDVDALEDAIASGALLVRHGSKMVQYQSFDVMQKILLRIKRQLRTPKPRTCSFGYFRRGDY